MRGAEKNSSIAFCCESLMRNVGEIKICLLLKLTSAKNRFGMNFYNSPEEKRELYSCAKMRRFREGGTFLG